MIVFSLGQLNDLLLENLVKDDFFSFFYLCIKYKLNFPLYNICSFLDLKYSLTWLSYEREGETKKKKKKMIEQKIEFKKSL